MSSTSPPSTNRIGEIFSFAGSAFSKLGELTMHLNSSEFSDVNHSGQKWDEEDVEMFRLTVKKFGEDLEKLSETIKNKTVSQLKEGIKRKMNENKNSVNQPNARKVSKSSNSPISPLTNQSKVITKPVQSTINSFNASIDSVMDEVDA